MKREAKTLKELFICKFEALEAENAELTERMRMLAQENRALREEVEKAKAFVSEYLSVERDRYGEGRERRLSLSRSVSEWLAFGKEEKAKATEAIEYALSMGAEDETKGEAAEGDAPEAEAAKG